MREHYPNANIEHEYSIEKTVQKLRNKRLKKEIAFNRSKTCPTAPQDIHPDDFINSLKTPCEPKEINGMIVYSPGNSIEFKDVP